MNRDIRTHFNRAVAAVGSPAVVPRGPIELVTACTHNRTWSCCRGQRGTIAALHTKQRANLLRSHFARNHKETCALTDTTFITQTSAGPKPRLPAHAGAAPTVVDVLLLQRGLEARHSAGLARRAQLQQLGGRPLQLSRLQLRREVAPRLAHNMGGYELARPLLPIAVPASAVPPFPSPWRALHPCCRYRRGGPCINDWLAVGGQAPARCAPAAAPVRADARRPPRGAARGCRSLRKHQNLSSGGRLGPRGAARRERAMAH